MDKFKDKIDGIVEGLHIFKPQSWQHRSQGDAKRVLMAILTLRENLVGLSQEDFERTILKALE
jgi:hypothetical protein